jgi:hypothetical protein
MSTDVDTLPTRADIDALQRVAVELEQYEGAETFHHFAHGMYCREMRTPAGCVVIGKVHKTEHLFMLLAGEMTLICDGFRERIKAPFIAVSKPGMKRAMHMHSDTVCANVHEVGELRDLEEIERLLIEDDPTVRFDAFNRLKVARLK